MPWVKLGVTVRPPDTAVSSVTVNAIPSPSAAEASAIVTAGVDAEVRGAGASPSWRIVPVAVSVCVTVSEVPETVRLTVNVSSGSWSVSSVVVTVKLCVSPAVPAKVSPVVFSV